MTRFRGPLALLLSAAALLGLIACTPFGGDDDDQDPGPFPTATDIPVVMSTFTPTEVVPPAGQTATAEVEMTEAAEAEETRGALPTPTLAGTVLPPEQLLWPPRARLETPDALVEGALGTYSWQFSDEQQSFAAIDRPIIPLDQGEPAELQNGAQVAVRLYGDEYRLPPQQLEVAIYDYESNSATPVNPQTGEAAEGPAFAIRTEPLQRMRVDASNPTLTLDGFQPGHYIIWAQGRWGQHPVLNRPIFVTWVFDIEITG